MQIINSLTTLAQRKVSLALIAIVSLALFLPSGKAAMVINVDFNGGSSTNTYSGQGAYSDPGHNTWNAFSMSADGNWNASLASGALVDSAGGATSALVTLYGSRSFDFTTFSGGVDASGNALIDDFAYTPSSDTNPTIPGFTFAPGYAAGFRISGLTPGASYSLYLFGSSGIQLNSVDFLVDGTTQAVTGRTSASSPPLFTAGVDYTTYSITADGSGFIDGNYKGVTTQGAFSGLQLVAAVPEPTTVTLLALGGLALVMRSRMRQRKLAV